MPETIVDAVDFKNAMARFASGVTVVITKDEDRRLVGFTASAFSSLSLDPPLVLVCLEKRADCYEAFKRAPSMTISVLAAEQGDLAWRFATKNIDKFEGTPVVTGEATGLPLIEGATVRLECRMHDRLPGGDHTILVGEVLMARSTDDAPLIHYNRRFGVFQVPEED